MVELPWYRRPGESEEAYAAFLAYRDLGADRSQEAASKLISRSRQNLGLWSAKHDWVERCRSWDNHIQRDRDKVAAAEARKWERRRQAALEENWRVAQSLRGKLEQMLKFPLQRTETSKDGKTIVIEPARWTFQAVALLAKTAAEIEAAVLFAVASDPDDLTDVETRAIVEGPEVGEARERPKR